MLKPVAHLSYVLAFLFCILLLQLANLHVQTQAHVADGSAHTLVQQTLFPQRSATSYSAQSSTGVFRCGWHDVPLCGVVVYLYWLMVFLHGTVPIMQVPQAHTPNCRQQESLVLSTAKSDTELEGFQPRVYTPALG